MCRYRSVCINNSISICIILYYIVIIYTKKNYFLFQFIDEAVEHFELLTKIAPKWCQFSTNKNKNDLLTINTSIPTWEAREIVEEGMKNFR